MSRDKQDASNNITGKKYAGCFVTSFCKEHGQHQKRINADDKLQDSQPRGQINQAAKTSAQSISVNQTDLPKCKMLIMGDFTQSSQRKELYLSAIDWKTLPGSRAPKFYSEKTADHHLIIHSISECDQNSYPLALRNSTYIVLIPSSTQDFSQCYHAVFDRHQLLSAESKVVYLNLAKQGSEEYLAIEVMAKKWIDKGINLVSVDATSVDMLIKKAVEHTRSAHQQLSDTDYNTTKDYRGSTQAINGV